MYKPTVKAAATREDSERSGQGSIIHRVKRSADKTAARTIGRLTGLQQIRSRSTSTEDAIIGCPAVGQTQRRNLIQFVQTSQPTSPS